MLDFRTAIYVGLLAVSLGLGACSTTTTTGNISTFVSRLSGASEVPPATGNGKGMLQANLNKQTRVLSWTVTYTGLSGPAINAHFHGPAMPGDNAGVALPLGGNLASPIMGVATLTELQVAELLAGNWYVNLHTALHPGGEIRGQLSVWP